MSNLKLEVFESNKPIEPITFFIYKLTPKEQVDSIQQLMRSAAGKISYRQKIPTFTDDKRIITLKKFENLEIDKSFNLAFEKEEDLDIQTNKKIYSDVVTYFINEILRNKKMNLMGQEYSKYKIGKDITTVWIEELKKSLSSDDKMFRIRRKFDFSIKNSNDNKLQL